MLGHLDHTSHSPPEEKAETCVTSQLDQFCRARLSLMTSRAAKRAYPSGRRTSLAHDGRAQLPTRYHQSCRPGPAAAPPGPATPELAPTHAAHPVSVQSTLPSNPSKLASKTHALRPVSATARAQNGPWSDPVDSVPRVVRNTACIHAPPPSASQLPVAVHEFIADTMAPPQPRLSSLPESPRSGPHRAKDVPGRTFSAGAVHLQHAWAR